MNPITLTERQIRQLLEGAAPQPLHNPYPADFLEGPPHPAAILIPLTRIDDSWHLLFIRRTENKHDHHGGQVAFPGGRMNPADPTSESTALREAQEEVGLNPADVRILGHLNDFLSITNYRVTPIVGTFPWPYLIQMDPAEVSRTFTIPITWLAAPENRQIMYRNTPPHKPWPVIYFDSYDGEVLWGFSARVTLRLLEVLGLWDLPG